MIFNKESCSHLTLWHLNKKDTHTFKFNKLLPNRFKSRYYEEYLFTVGELKRFIIDNLVVHNKLYLLNILNSKFNSLPNNETITFKFNKKICCYTKLSNFKFVNVCLTVKEFNKYLVPALGIKLNKVTSTTGGNN